jgi:predicted ester cyclase/ketosteroid isomerase-like protein
LRDLAIFDLNRALWEEEMKTLSFSCCVLLVVLSACGCAEAVDEEALNKALILRANDEILNKGNLAIVEEVFASDYVNEGTERGPDLISEFATSLRAAFPDLRVKVEPIVAEGDMVAWLRSHSGTHQGDFLGVPASGQSVTWQSLAMSQIKDGKIVEEWGVTNLPQQLPVAAVEEDGSFSEQDAAAVRENLQSFAGSSPIKSPETFFAQFTDDIHWSPGPDFVATNIQELRDGPWCTEIEHMRNVDRVEGSANLAYVRGTFQLSLDCGNDELDNLHGTFLSVHRRQADGTWRIATMTGVQS